MEMVLIDEKDRCVSLAMHHAYGMQAKTALDPGSIKQDIQTAETSLGRFKLILEKHPIFL
jgi:hypothetical protein